MEKKRVRQLWKDGVKKELDIFVYFLPPRRAAPQDNYMLPRVQLEQPIKDK